MTGTARDKTAQLVARRSSFWPLVENVLRYRQRGENVRPADVEREMRHHLAGLGLRETVIHRAVEVVRNLRHLTRRYQCADGDETAVARRKVRSEPEVAEEHVRGVL